MCESKAFDNLTLILIQPLTYVCQRLYKKRPFVTAEATVGIIVKDAGNAIWCDRTLRMLHDGQFSPDSLIGKTCVTVFFDVYHVMCIPIYLAVVYLLLSS